MDDGERGKAAKEKDEVRAILLSGVQKCMKFRGRDDEATKVTDTIIRSWQTPEFPLSKLRERVDNLESAAWIKRQVHKVLLLNAPPPQISSPSIAAAPAAAAASLREQPKLAAETATTANPGKRSVAPRTHSAADAQECAEDRELAWAELAALRGEPIPERSGTKRQRKLCIYLKQSDTGKGLLISGETYDIRDFMKRVLGCKWNPHKNFWLTRFSERAKIIAQLAERWVIEPREDHSRALILTLSF